MKLTLVKGLPGSGKTTWGKQQQSIDPNIIRVNKDELRAMLHNSIHSKGREKFIIEIRNYIVMKALEEGHNVIIDDTNFNPVHEDHMRTAAKQATAEFLIKDMRNDHEPEESYLERCIKNDLKRCNSVGEKVIRTMFNTYVRKAGTIKEPIVKIEGVKNAIICDLDGTLCLFGDKNPYERDFENDQANEAVLNHLYRIDQCNFDGVGAWTDILFVSGRSSKHYDVTRKWLDDLGLRIYPLFMRKENDVRKDSIIKKELFNESISGKWNIDYVLDDRNQVVEMWRDLGLTCLQVAPGDF